MQGKIRTKDILKIEIKNMDQSKTEDEHALLIDLGSEKHNFNTPYRF